MRITVDGLPFFGEQVWSRDIPLLTIAYGLGNEDREPPEDEDEDDAASATTDNGSGDDATEPDDTDNE